MVHRFIGRHVLALIAASLVGVVYYLRVIYVLFMKEEECSPEGLPLAFGGRATAILARLLPFDSAMRCPHC